MATHLERQFSIDAPPDKVMAAMRDPAQTEESEKSREALSVQIDELKKTDDRHEYDVKVVNHARTIAGIDKTKTESSKTLVKWDLAKRTAEWVWSGEHGTVKI